MPIGPRNTAIARHWVRIFSSACTQERPGTRYHRATWKREGFPNDLLLPAGRKLAEGEELLSTKPDAIGPLARTYIETSIKVEGERQVAIKRAEQDRLTAERRGRRLRALIGVLVFGVVAGLVGWRYEDRLRKEFFRYSQVWPNVLTAEHEQALKPKEAFRECKDCPEMVVVPEGKFQMGSPPNEKNPDEKEGPQHEVSIAKPFAVSKFEVTFDEWNACVTYGDCSSRGDAGWGRGKQPVISVGWDDAKRYVRWLSDMTGKEYRLLSEAEWEYAARAETTTAYFWGDKIGRGNANCNGCGSPWDNSRAAPAGSFKANAFGLHDMHGNVWEWVEDCWSSNYRDAPTDGSAQPASGSCAAHVVRGGAWDDPAPSARSAYRGNLTGSGLDSGFRIARTLMP
jgi:formylglycine-generating enzyme required for sulfatase activity